MILSVNGVTVRRGTATLLNNVTWSVGPGEHWAVLGLNGSGKTTLLNLLNGYFFPAEGTVTVLEKMFGTYDLRELRKQIGWVSTVLQEKLHGSDTVEEVVLSGRFASVGLYDAPEESDLHLARELMARMSLSTMACREYRTLSQGEKQKALVARGLMATPDLLILDEPCTGLDVFARQDLLEHIDKIGASFHPTLLYVTHHIEEVLPVFTHVLLLREGAVHSQGCKEAVLTSENLRDFFGRPVTLSTKDGGYRLSF